MKRKPVRQDPIDQAMKRLEAAVKISESLCEAREAHRVKVAAMVRAKEKIESLERQIAGMAVNLRRLLGMDREAGE